LSFHSACLFGNLHGVSGTEGNPKIKPLGNLDENITARV
jgi:hypothetical protein